MIPVPGDAYVGFINRETKRFEAAPFKANEASIEKMDQTCGLRVDPLVFDEQLGAICHTLDSPTGSFCQNKLVSEIMDRTSVKPEGGFNVMHDLWWILMIVISTLLAVLVMIFYIRKRRANSNRYNQFVMDYIDEDAVWHDNTNDDHHQHERHAHIEQQRQQQQQGRRSSDYNGNNGGDGDGDGSLSTVSSLQLLTTGQQRWG